MSYAFIFDASSCSGCKACQAACKDKNDLSPGVLWRRVIEVSGGEWQRSGDAWINSVFAYNFSMACNHCVHPKCAGVCPVNAYHVREDGIVLLDSAKCVGCGYCNWACPYAVPQYDSRAGHMSKCNFCFDYIDAGQEPACVAACPLRALGFAKDDETISENSGLQLWTLSGTEHPFPLPEFSRTQPHILLKPHLAMANDLEKVIANREEIRPAKEKSENPLVAFTLLAQMAVGVFWITPRMFTPLWALIDPNIYLRWIIPSVLVGSALLLGMTIAFAHLGTKRNAWRMLGNLRKSWLSKEILFMGLFGISWLLFALVSTPIKGILYWLTALFGFGLIYSMANIYYLRSMPDWNTWRTLSAFLLSALLLGLFLLLPISLVERYLPEFKLFSGGYIGWISITALICELMLDITVNWKTWQTLNWIRAVLTLLIIVGVIFLFIVPVSIQVIYCIGLFLLLLTEETIGRRLFYSKLNDRIL